MGIVQSLNYFTILSLVLLLPLAQCINAVWDQAVHLNISIFFNLVSFYEM
jgi:hypothetical protein